MIEIVCDNCEVPFEVDSEEVGEKVACPECGDINRILDHDLPDADGPEEDLLVVRPAMFRSKPVRYSTMVLLVVGGIALAIWGGTKATPWIVWLGLGLAVVGTVGWTAWYIVHLGQRVRITNKRTIYLRGILSRHTNEVLHNHIRNLQIKQTLFQRMLNVGDIVLDSSAGGGQSSAEIKVYHVPRPTELKRIIDQYRSL